MRKQKILTKEIERRLKKYPIYSQENKGAGATVVFRIFHPWSKFSFYILEGEKQEYGDWLFFGYNPYCEGEEYGYLTLSQIESVVINVNGFLFPIERDIFVKGDKKLYDELATCNE